MPHRSKLTSSRTVTAIHGNQFGQVQGQRIAQTEYGVLSLLCTPDDHVWVGFRHGTVVYQQHRGHQEREMYSPMFTWFHDRVWVATMSNNLLLYDTGQWQLLPLPFDRCHRLAAHPEGFLVAVGMQGLWVSSDGTTWTYIPLPPNTTHITNLWVGDPKKLWFTTTHTHAFYTYEWQTGQLEAVPFPQFGRRARDPSVIGAFAHPSHGFWASINGIGLCHWNGAEWHRAPKARDYASSGITGYPEDFCLDKFGRIWGATTAGLNVYDNAEWRPVMLVRSSEGHAHATMFTPTGVPNCRRLSLSARGRLWIGTNYGELLWVDTTQPLTQRSPDDPIQQEAMSRLLLHTL